MTSARLLLIGDAIDRFMELLSQIQGLVGTSRFVPVSTEEGLATAQKIMAFPRHMAAVDVREDVANLILTLVAERDELKRQAGRLRGSHGTA